jgi:hypothetical protein
MQKPQKAAENAEILALEGLGWLAGTDGGLERLLAASGTDLDGLKAAAGNPETALALLEFLLANEDLLLAFCDDAGRRPAELHAARRALAGDAL